MTIQEKEPLIKPQQGKQTKKRSFMRYTLFPMCLFSVFTYAYGIGFYTYTQWVHKYLAMELFPNATVNSSAAAVCKVTNHSDPDYITFEKVESQTALWQMYYTLALTIPSLFSSILLPSYSDAYGRRFLFIIAVSGIFLKACVVTATVYFKQSLLFFVAGSLIEGITGSFYTVDAACYSYIADITSVGRQRTVGIAIYDGIMMFTTTFAGPVAGVLIQKSGYFVTLSVFAVLSAATLILTIMFLPETHEKKNRSKKVSVFSNFRRTVDFYGSSAFRGKRAAYLLLIAAFLFEELSTTHRSTLEMLYQMGKPFCWNSEQIGYFSAARHAGPGLLGTLFLVPMKKCLSDLQIAIFSTISNTGAYVLEAFARTDLTLYIVNIIAIWSYLTVAMVKSIMSSMTSADKQGSIFASVEAMHSISGIIASFMFNPIYAATVHIMNGFVFLVLAAVAMLVFFILVIFACTQTVHRVSEEQEPSEKEEAA